MKPSPASPPRPTRNRTVSLAAVDQFNLVELANASPLRAQVLPSGALFALRHGPTLLNQFLPGPAENGLFRLLLRWRDPSGRVAGYRSLVAAGESFTRTSASRASWRSAPVPGLSCETHLELHPTLAAWTWRIHLRNDSRAALRLDALHAQDLGVADEAAVRNNEAYTSHYIDFLPVDDAALGWTLLVRQNQAQSGGRRPWLAFGCTPRGAAFCTDGWQFFGADHRLTNEPAAARAPALPSQRLQYEFALAGLQSECLELAPGSSGEIVFTARFLEDHPAASSPGDVAHLREVLDAKPRSPSPAAAELPAARVPGASASPSLFTSASWLHGDVPAERDWAAWFPGARRHEERSREGRLLAFFTGQHTHVVSREKEAHVLRPHGHILRSGDARGFDAVHFGLTAYAAGIFSAQAYLTHSSFARLLSVVRNALNVTRASGQRVFLRRGDRWVQLGLPSAFAISPGEIRWLYRFGADVIEAHVRCAAHVSAACLDLRVQSGAPATFLITHELVAGAAEFEHPATLKFFDEAAAVACRPSPESLVGCHQRDVCFAIAALDPSTVDAVGGDSLLYEDAIDRAGPYVVIATRPSRQCSVILCGTPHGPAALPDTLAAARAAFAGNATPAEPPSSPVRLAGHADASVARLDDVLPWFTHNAAIHFSAPHGLEQYGGAAWGVRDVCQGSIEWLLAAGEFAVARRTLERVFTQQYPADGGWPQWFMFPPYQFIQQAHSHGDVCFWPVKALCDYLEASNDLGFLQGKLGYTDAQRFEPAGPEETVLAHCDRVVAQCESRFLAGTALVNYGDGDWDDTLQPADPAMRTHMTSAWTVGLAFHTFRQLAEVCRRAGETARAARLDALLARMRRDFSTQLMPGGTVAGFLVAEPGKPARPLLHPQDEVTRIRYRLLPMTRAILAELFTPAEARHHLAIVARELSYPDGVRLMSEPSTYAGGVERLFRRAETAANVGREIGLQYVHAHLRYAEALAKIGDADGLLNALQVVNPVALAESVRHAAPRQSNVYFSSSDADFADRYEAEKRWPELRTGRVAVRGGWRLYSSGPGLFIHKVRACLLGVRERFDDVVFDPVLPRRLDGLRATIALCERPVELRFRLRGDLSVDPALTVNGVPLRTDRREPNPYRPGGLLVARSALAAALRERDNVVEIDT